MANKSLKSIILPVIVVVLAFAILYCVNLWTYPTIVQARMQGEVGPAMDVMPNAQGFMELTNGHILRGVQCFCKPVKVPALPKEKKEDS